MAAVVVLSTGRGDTVVVIVWGAELGGGEGNGRWYAGAVGALSTGRVDIVVVVGCSVFWQCLVGSIINSVVKQERKGFNLGVEVCKYEKKQGKSS